MGKTYFACYKREISSISRVMVLSKRVCHTRSITVPLDVFSTLPREPSVSSSTRRLVDVSSQNVSMSVLNTSSTPNLVKVSYRVVANNAAIKDAKAAGTYVN